MKLIFSRKGFDSGAGGCPSPIFPDGSMLSLPIPDPSAPFCYRDLSWRGRKLSDIMAPLKGARPLPHDHAHLDPDLIRDFQPRHPSWRPLLGQNGAAQSHLRNEGIGPGDLFLFFGLYRQVNAVGQFMRSAPLQHVIWGWLQVDEVIQVDNPRGELSWAGRHPHISRPPDPSNTLYRAKSTLNLPGNDFSALPGAGVFERFHPRLRLSDPLAKTPSIWRLPAWFSPQGRPTGLSYHGDPDRWELEGDSVRLQTVGRGQEFVWDAKDYPESLPWITSLLTGEI